MIPFLSNIESWLSGQPLDSDSESMIKSYVYTLITVRRRIQLGIDDPILHALDPMAWSNCRTISGHKDFNTKLA